jgi:hypothetical protein
MSKINIFLLNKKNEIFLIYDDNDHEWKLPSYQLSIDEIIDIFIKNMKMSFDIEMKYDDNNYLCRLNNQLLCNHDKKWFYYSQIVDMKMHVEHEKIIEQIYDKLKIVVILDIDLTLLESCIRHDNLGSKKPNNIMEYKGTYYFVWFRPHLRYFLELLSKFANVVYWTAATKDFQEKVLSITDLMKFCKSVYYRDTCDFDGLNYIKNINKIPFDKNKTILIDDNYVHKNENPSNCLLIKRWEPSANSLDECDMELLKILNILKKYSELIMHHEFTIQNCIDFYSREKNCQKVVCENCAHIVENYV